MADKLGFPPAAKELVDFATLDGLELYSEDGTSSRTSNGATSGTIHGIINGEEKVEKEEEKEELLKQEASFENESGLLFSEGLPSSKKQCALLAKLLDHVGYNKRGLWFPSGENDDHFLKSGIKTNYDLLQKVFRKLRREIDLGAPPVMSTFFCAFLAGKESVYQESPPVNKESPVYRAEVMETLMEFAQCAELEPKQIKILVCSFKFSCSPLNRPRSSSLGARAWCEKRSLKVSPVGE
jgi:hypothetical protein